ncbi:MAG: hypothetical protein ACE5E7_19130, partial [Anaerolineae bacterium]
HETWIGEADRLRHLQEAAAAAREFRAFCLENSLLDLSLVVEVFDTQLVQHAEFRRYFSERYRHLIVDNVEEQTPAGQNLIKQLMDAAQTSAIAYDAGGGYKRFLAADPLGANQFRGRCQSVYEFKQPFNIPPAMTDLANLVENYLMHTRKPAAAAGEAITHVVVGRYRREMVDRLVLLLSELTGQAQIPPDQIAIITPYLDGALRYMLANTLAEAGLPHNLLRRRSSPREEPRVRAWLTWLALAHPDWNVSPAPYDVAEALSLSIHDLDPARAQLLTDQLYQAEAPMLRPVSELPEAVIARVGRGTVGLVEELRLWLDAQNGRVPIDFFLHRLFDQLLSQRRFQPEPDLPGAAVCDWLVKSATRLRQSAEAIGLHTAAEVGRAFITGINQGLVTANPPELGAPSNPEGITISTIYGFLLGGRAVRVQVWLETAATGWWDIPNQPLSNAFILARSRDPSLAWTAEEDFAIRNQLLSRIVRGLVNRCAEAVILANSDLDRRGQRQAGPLWRALQPLLAAAPAGE